MHICIYAYVHNYIYIYIIIRKIYIYIYNDNNNNNNNKFGLRAGCGALAGPCAAPTRKQVPFNMNYEL